MSVDSLKDLVHQLRPDLHDKGEFDDDVDKVSGLVMYCNMCKQDKPSSFFYDRRGNKYSYCRPCRNRWQHRRKVLALIHPKPDNCELCGLPFEEKGRYRADIDHCHDSDEFRGWLHACCNKGLGQFQDNTELLQKAIQYLQAKQTKENQQ